MNSEEIFKMVSTAEMDPAVKANILQYMENMTFHDHELNMPNFLFYRREIGKILSTEKRVLYCNCVFNFSRLAVLNQRIGRPATDLVIKRFIGQLQEILGEKGIVCRIGGDNFVTAFKKEMTEIVVKYLQGTPIVYNDENGESAFVRTNAGFFNISENITSFDQCMDASFFSMFAAKRSMETSTVFYDEKLRHRKKQIDFVMNSFSRGIKEEEFLVYYQPKVLLQGYKLGGAEALCRWNHGENLVPPDDFVPILEQSNAICTLDFYMLEHVCRDIRRWLDKGKNIVRISVNLSRRHLGDIDIVKKLLNVIDRYQVPHEYIEIELTETTTDVEFNDLKTLVEGLKSHGIHTSVDDFGVGYSSLNLIRQVAWDVIKIDKCFLPTTREKNSNQYVMLKHLFSMLHDLGLKCIVEGVETMEQVKMLKENNCYLAQGYFFDKPLTADEFETRFVPAESEGL